MILRLFFNRFNFLDLLEEQVGHAVEAACFFGEVTAQGHVTEEMLNRMAQIEHEGDNAAHTIIQRLNKTFLTPFDRQDVHHGQTNMNPTPSRIDKNGGSREVSG